MVGNGHMRRMQGEVGSMHCTARHCGGTAAASLMRAPPSLHACVPAAARHRPHGHAPPAPSPRGAQQAGLNDAQGCAHGPKPTWGVFSCAVGPDLALPDAWQRLPVDVAMSDTQDNTWVSGSSCSRPGGRRSGGTRSGV